MKIERSDFLPAIFEAIAKSNDYNGFTVLTKKPFSKDIFLSIAVEDVQNAADFLRSL
jgi:hypothetical protein